MYVVMHARRLGLAVVHVRMCVCCCVDFTRKQFQHVCMYARMLGLAVVHVYVCVASLTISSSCPSLRLEPPSERSVSTVNCTFLSSS